MPLNLYVFKEALPADQKLLWDVEKEWALAAGLYPRPPIVNKALEEIDGSPVVSDLYIRSKLTGGEVSISACSTGVKAIWLLALDLGVVNVLECGANALEFIFREFRRGSVLQPIRSKYDHINIGTANGPTDVVFNSKHYSSIEELYVGLEEFPWS